MHDNVVQEERFVVDFDVPRQKAIEVLHIPAGKFQILTGLIFFKKITGRSLRKGFYQLGNLHLDGGKYPVSTES